MALFKKYGFFAFIFMIVLTTAYSQSMEKIGKVKIVNNSSVPVDVTYLLLEDGTLSDNKYTRVLGPKGNFIAGKVDSLALMSAGVHGAWKGQLTPARMLFEKKDYDIIMNEIKKGKTGDLELSIEEAKPEGLFASAWQYTGLPPTLELKKTWIKQLGQQQLPASGDPFDAFPRMYEKKSAGWKIKSQDDKKVVMVDPYGYEYSTDAYILGVPEDAKKHEIEKAFKELSLKWHPDKHREPAKNRFATEIFKILKNAYDNMMAKTK